MHDTRYTSGNSLIPPSAAVNKKAAHLRAAPTTDGRCSVLPYNSSEKSLTALTRRNSGRRSVYPLVAPTPWSFDQTRSQHLLHPLSEPSNPIPAEEKVGDLPRAFILAKVLRVDRYSSIIARCSQPVGCGCLIAPVMCPSVAVGGGRATMLGSWVNTTCSD